MSDTPIRIVLVDDHAILRQGLRSVLEREEDLTVVGEASSETEAEAVVNAADPGVVLLDLYRDVKTGHPEEALMVFGRAMPALRDQLGVRSADAWMLVAAAHHAPLTA